MKSEQEIREMINNFSNQVQYFREELEKYKDLPEFYDNGMSYG